jgi:hypothetical protein
MSGQGANSEVASKIDDISEAIHENLKSLGVCQARGGKTHAATAKY